MMTNTNKLSVAAGIFLATILGAAANQITYQVNLSVQLALGNFHPASGDTVIVAGTFSTTDWTTTSTLTAIPGNTNVFSGTFNNDGASGSFENHKFIINPGGNSPANLLNWESINNRFFQVTAANQTLSVVYFNDITNIYIPGEFIAGADMSHLRFFEDRGIVYRDKGAIQDALTILKNRGVNCVRLRLFTGSAAQAQVDPYNYTNNLTYNLPLAVRVKNAGLKFLLDYHYSDSWADPGKQFTPTAWTNLTFAQLVQQMRTYNSNTIATFAAAGAIPDYVQIGNEITSGMLWNLGKVNAYVNGGTQWSQLGQLMTNAIQGIRDAAGTNMPKIIVHIDRGGDWTTTMKYFDNLIAQGVLFDIIGESYYPWWHGNLNDLSNCLNNAAARYGKPVMVMETAFPRSNSTNIFGIPATTNGQVQFVTELAKIVKSVPGGKGAGIFWWAAEYQQLSGTNLAGFENRSLFGNGGDVLPAADAFGSLTAPVVITPTLSNTTLVLRWPLSGAGMTLTSNTNLAQPGWINAPNIIDSTGGVFKTSESLNSAPSRFYRLKAN